MGRRGGGKDIHDEAFVVTVYGKVHFPTVFRTPVPIEHLSLIHIFHRLQADEYVQSALGLQHAYLSSGNLVPESVSE